jgi:hypothetical protein
MISRGQGGAGHDRAAYSFAGPGCRGCKSTADGPTVNLVNPVNLTFAEFSWRLFGLRRQRKGHPPGKDPPYGLTGPMARLRWVPRCCGRRVPVILSPRGGGVETFGAPSLCRGVERSLFAALESVQAKIAFCIKACPS